MILPDGNKIPYVELSAEASKIPPVLDAKPRDPSQWRILGKPMMRLDVRVEGHGRNEVRHRPEDGRHAVCAPSS